MMSMLLVIRGIPVVEFGRVARMEALQENRVPLVRPERITIPRAGRVCRVLKAIARQLEQQVVHQ